MYETLLAIHILAAVLWIGGGVTMHIFGRMALASGDGARIVDFTRQGNMIGPRFYAPLAFVLLIAGMLLVEEVGYEYDLLWINLGFAAWIVSFLVGILFYSRQGRRLDALVEAEGVDAPGVVQITRRVANVNTIELTILLLVVIDMAVKPT